MSAKVIGKKQKQIILKIWKNEHFIPNNLKYNAIYTEPIVKKNIKKANWYSSYYYFNVIANPNNIIINNGPDISHSVTYFFIFMHNKGKANKTIFFRKFFISIAIVCKGF